MLFFFVDWDWKYVENLGWVNLRDSGENRAGFLGYWCEVVEGLN